MRDVDTIKRKKRAAAYVIAPIIVFALTYGVYYSQALAGKEDISKHMQYALSFDTAVRVAHCAWHLVCYALYVCLPISIEMAAGLATALYNALTAVIVIWMIERFFGRETLDHAAMPIAVTLIALLVGPLYLRFYNRYYYLGQGSPNVWLNPTTLAVRPFMLLTGVVTIDYWKMGRTDERIRIGRWSLRKATAYQLLLALLLFCSTLAKPSYFMAYGPACFIIEVGRWIRGKCKGFFSYLGRNLYFFPSLFLFLSQYIRIYLFGGMNQTESTVVIAFWKAAGRYAPSVPFSLVLRMAFPLIVIIIWRKELFGDMSFRLISLQYVIAVLISWTFAEVGSREKAGNFGWGNILCSSFLWIYCLMFFVRQWRQDHYTFKKARYVIPACFLLWHLAAGITALPRYIYM